MLFSTLETNILNTSVSNLVPRTEVWDKFAFLRVSNVPLKSIDSYIYFSSLSSTRKELIRRKLRRQRFLLLPFIWKVMSMTAFTTLIFFSESANKLKLNRKYWNEDALVSISMLLVEDFNCYYFLFNWIILKIY